MRTARVAVRPLTPDDVAAVDTVFAGLSARGRHLRFHTPVARLTAAMRAALLDVDGCDRAALVAEARRPGRWGRTPVGIARMVRTGAGEAELAVAVVDDWQGRGVGRRLLTELGDLARDLGYDRLFGLVLPENGAVVALLQRVFPGAAPCWDDGAVRVDCPLTVPEITDEDLITALTGGR
ncbi:GNAT family N-acetyltransferase [Pseudonocardia sp. KRD-184]|uniref:GNAT family N-acetyltransferase n=1 Tax=Pseudonocardia oceani TaxID=2792013 RepID=A0ABS6UBE0_9PSEU|nr:GNAT family N-acetyltransferase [Pseudonocardia oceani]MBW0092209.1 GNAT family N-acetyltransferase [Pseudonocardia oceani]MBW0098934.1 GNAT family N-acetyltransferase [Pseudonocardia oceani]MBW0111451.1 GNAT family N-acetyltransferase [Pseudonocardia oceani]MBW0125170.1 GNAT family N-acetyltransferase [Pseudonocardia oceani]MBW0129561.1 GNAT family N-acetyltransferase [Pseudonocardia oceani]